MERAVVGGVGHTVYSTSADNPTIPAWLCKRYEGVAVRINWAGTLGRLLGISWRINEYELLRTALAPVLARRRSGLQYIL